MLRRIQTFFKKLRWWGYVLMAVLGVVLVVGAIVGGYGAMKLLSRTLSNSREPIIRWFDESDSRAELITVRDETACGDAPFILPTDGFIGLLYYDSAGPYDLLHPHTGVDIFGDGEPGTVPVYAAYDGYLTRLPDWFSTVIIRHDDPLEAGRTIWSYYTHMGSADGNMSFVDEAFPPGTDAVWVERGTLIGHQGDYGGSMTVGLHLHFSLVLSNADGSFMNEARIQNTLDPSPYFGMPLHIASRPERPINCMTDSAP